MTGKRIGYIRVSTPDQNPDRQLENIELDKRFVDYASAKSTDRPQLKAMLNYIRDDDIVFVHSMDRLARNLEDLKKLVNLLVSRKIKVHFMKEGLHFTDENCAASNLILHVMGALAEFEHAFIVERIREGVALARKEGRLQGRPSNYTPEVREKIKVEMQTRKTKTEIAKSIGISRPALNRYLGLMKESS